MGSYNEAQSKYVFYGSLIEGARGALWYMYDLNNYSDYTHQKTVYAMFTNSASFSNQPRTPDSNIFLTGSELPVENLTTTNGFATPNYPLAITKRCSIKAFSYTSGVNTKWRIYAVNHMDSLSTGIANITGTPPSQTAYKRDSTDYVTLTPQGPPVYRFTDILNANACQFYDLG